MNPHKEKLELIGTGSIRVRYAPSPTGFLHIGGARAALFNYLFAKKNQGSFILRIEDTDKERFLPKFEKDILEGLKWLDLYWDEGPRNGKDYIGDFGPYHQSERSLIYEKYIKKLLEKKEAYYCFCSKEDLESQKQYQMSRGEVPKYNGKCLEISDEEAKKMIKNNSDYVIRLKIPPQKVKFKDIIRGEIEFDTSTMGDIVIARDIKTPLYNLAVVIDDYEMKISDVIRGEDHISNTPKQIMIIEILGFPIPRYAHMPLVLGPDKSKLSKRHGAVSLIEYKNQGYLPEAIINVLSFLGWNPGTDREIYSISHLIKDFSLEKVQKSGAIFNIKKLDFINGFYIRQKSIENLTPLCIPYLVDSGLIIEKDSGKYEIKESKKEIGIDYIQKIVSINHERLKKLSEISEFSDFFFKDILDYEKNLLFWKENPEQEIYNSLDKTEKLLLKLNDWTIKGLEKEIMLEAEKAGDRGKILWPLRVALTGKKSSPGPIEIAEILGKSETIERINRAKNKVKPFGT